MQPTSPDNLKKINAALEAIEPTLSDLAWRWADERLRRYEDINEYTKVIQANLPPSFEVVKMLKRPFGFQFKIGTEAVYAMKLGARSFSWSRVS